MLNKEQEDERSVASNAPAFTKARSKKLLVKDAFEKVLKGLKSVKAKAVTTT